MVKSSERARDVSAESGFGRFGVQRFGVEGLGFRVEG